MRYVMQQNNNNTNAAVYTAPHLHIVFSMHIHIIMSILIIQKCAYRILNIFVNRLFIINVSVYLVSLI